MNPILSRELKVITRSRKMFCLLLVYLGALFLLVMAVWPKEGVHSFAESASRSILTVVAMGQLALVALFAPAFTSTAVVYEKENRSFDLLFATLLQPREIVTGKLVSSLAGTLLIVCCALPFTAACILLGGVGLGELVRVYIVLCATAVWFGMIGLTVSAFARTSYSALVTSYLLILVFSVGIAIPFYGLEEWTAATPVLVRLKNLSPFASMLTVVQPQVWLAGGERFAGIGAWAYFPAAAAVGTVACALFLVVKIRKPPAVKPRRRDVLIHGAGAVIKRKLKFPFYLIDPMKRKRQISRLANCVFEKERRTHLFGNASYIVRAMYVSFIVSLCLVGISCIGMEIEHLDYLVAVAAAFQLGIVILMVPSLTAASITSEIETRNLDMLRMTPLGGRTIVAGKIMYALVMLIPVLVSCGPVWYLFANLGAVGTNLIPAGAVLVATVLFAVSTGMVCSSFSQRTSTATAVTYGIVLLVNVGTLLPAVLGETFHAKARGAILSMNPLAASVQVIAHGMFKDLPSLWQANLRFLCGASVLFLVVAAIRVQRLMRQER